MQLILDTNILVAAGFNQHSSSAKIIAAIRAGKHQLVWDQVTLRETQKIITQIPPLPWHKFADLFQPAGEFHGLTERDDFKLIEDPDDRKFAALAAATGATIITNDDHLLGVRDQLDIKISTPRELTDKQ